MKNMPLVSVVIPMYNAEKFIDKCILHLIHQTYQNLEIIIVDDGSTDNSVSVCQKYADNDSRIKIIKQKNGGPSVALNTGLANAHGQWIHFHDHDDFVNLDYFEIMMNAARITDADILCGEVNQPDYNFPRFDHMEICISLADKIQKTHANKFNPAWRYVYKKSFLDESKLTYEPAIFGAQDIYFTKPAIILARTVSTVPNAIYNVVNTDTALGKKRNKLRQTAANPDAIAARERYARFLAQHNATELITAPDVPARTESVKVFNKTIFRKDIFTKRIRYYLFGINIGTKHLNP